MPIEVWYDDDARLIRVRASGEDPVQEWKASKAQVLQLKEKYACDKLLADARGQEGTPDINFIYSFGASLPREIRCAVLVGKGTGEQHRFLETVAVNRGIPIRDFTEESDAVAWLTRQP